jgi:hypothetical protein
MTGGTEMRHLATRGLLAVLTTFLAVTTVTGAALVVPTLPLEWLEGSFFTDYSIPALALAFVGGLSLVALGALLLRPEFAGIVAVAAGLSMIAYELVEIWVAGLSLVEYGPGEPVAWLQVAFLAVGALTAAAGLSLWHATEPDRERLSRTASHVAS